MRAIRLRRLGLPLAALVGLTLVVTAQVAQEPALVRLAKAQPVEAPPDLLAELLPVEELDAAWIVRARAATAAALRSHGVTLDQLPDPPAGHAFYLVYEPSPADLALLRTRGRVFAGDTATWLFLGSEDQVRDAIPAPLSFKRLMGEAAGPVVLRGTPAVPTAETTMAAIAPSGLPAELAAQVSRERLRGFIAELESFVSRYASTASCEAAGSYILEHFRRVGLAADADYFSFGSPTSFTTSNIIATLPGRADPDRVVIVSAHYDSFSDQRPAIAPGADDNASGTAAVMEAAVLLAPHAFDFTVRFVAFGAEEWGLIGSQRYAQAARERGEQIVAVLNLDMIGYADRQPEDLDIVGSASSQWLAARLAAAGAAVGPIASTTQVRSSFGSDCSPFWQAGYASVCGIEDFPLANPYYHRVTDRLETLDLDLAAAITRTTVATLAELAQPVSVPPTPAGLVARTRTSRSLFLRGRSVLLEWRAGGAAASGYHVYRAATSHGAYERVTAMPLRQTSYSEFVDPREDAFYVVTSIDGSGRESNFSGEVGVSREGQ